ncbi:MAG: hypothetical protein WC989_05775 [Micavibrio sp.]
MSDKRNRLIVTRIRDAQKSSERLSASRAMREVVRGGFPEDGQDDGQDFDMLACFDDEPGPRP